MLPLVGCVDEAGVEWMLTSSMALMLLQMEGLVRPSTFTRLCFGVSTWLTRMDGPSEAYEARSLRAGDARARVGVGPGGVAAASSWLSRATDTDAGSRGDAMRSMR